MKVNFYAIAAQYHDLKEQIDAAVLEVLDSGAYSLGKYHNLFEKQMAERQQSKYALAVNSGTDALRIIMDACGIGKGDEVITTAFTFVASTETIVQTGATPVFVDIDPITFMIDPAKIEAAITPKTKAILPIHLFGQMANMKAIMDLAAKHNLIVLEDAAQALDCHQNGVMAGNFGKAAGFSFYVTKNLGAIGDGGLITTNDDAIFEACKSIRVHGMGRERYYYDHVGYTSRLNELSAAVMSVKLSKLSDWNDNREKMGHIYLEELAGVKGIQLPETQEGNNNTFHQFCVLSEERDELQKFLQSKEVGCAIYYPVPLHFHQPYAHYGHGEGSLPITERVCRQILSLPIHPHLKEEEVRYVSACVREFATAGVS